jgi:c-di-GMP-binding flagellar brake protein YcgR
VQERPEIDDPVVLRDAADREHASRVEDLGQGLVVVVQPHDLSADVTYGNGAEITVSWADENGDVITLPTKILAAHGDDAVQLWSLVVTGPAEMAQRRKFERVEVEGPVGLRPTGGEDDDVVPGELVDVSEAALRCGVETGSADRFLGADNHVVAEFRLGDDDFAVPGRVEFVRATKRPTEVEDLIVLFDEPVADAARLRKQLHVSAASASADASQ